MEMMLAENIRRFRKQRSLTMEQLAESLGVTAGAVYKWEAKLSLPELHMILEMADFFDTSVDVLLGYKMKDNRLAATVQQLKEYRHDKDHAGLSAAEKALKKYPNAFDIVHESAVLYRVFGVESQENSMLRRALELLEESLVLLPQNTDPEISEQTIYGEMADVYLMLDEGEKSVELLKKHNAGGLYNDMIGLTLATNLRCPEEAVLFLSEALLQSVVTLIRTVSGYVNIFIARGDISSARAILFWGIALISGLKEAEKPGFLDKMGDDDVVMITADHGCDPAYTATTDHTREYIPLLVLGKKIKPVNLGTRTCFANIAATICDMFGVPLQTEGKSFLGEIL